MPYLQLALPCSEADQPRYERALEDVGALANGCFGRMKPFRVRYRPEADIRERRW